MCIYDTLNPPQREAVFHTEGPLLVLAGAGSGKTRVLTHRIAYLIQEQGVNPWNILAITFTNKAAGEMRQRVDSLIDFGAESIWVSTFHSACARILRRYIDLLGYDNRFSIYDTDDQKALMREICRKLQIDTKQLKERMLLSAISSAKNELILPDEYELLAEGDFIKKKVAAVYREYEAQMRGNNALDFDDLLVKTVQLLESQPEVLEGYQNRFRYIMVDEYQDTNTVQFRLVHLLSGRERNLCVVGDDDQSIYKFRGANIRNILDFEKTFPDAKVIKLEQNYRSTGNILEAANHVIQNNRGRKEKRLWTENAVGEKIRFQRFDTGFDEAECIAADIRDRVRKGGMYNDNAVLYRTNAQSRLFEEKMIARNIPYKIIGGVNFYARKEIKDLLAYLRTIENGQDDVSVRRIINVPKRGIGLTTIQRVQDSALERGISFYEALCSPELIPGIGRSASKLDSFAALIEYFRDEAGRVGLPGLLEEVIEKTNYVESLESDGKDDADSRKENIDELISKAAAFEEQCEAQGEEASLGAFLEEVALVADLDSLDETQDYVVLMTLHSAKGLEFPNVYLAGMEEGVFPGYMALDKEDEAELEEERRLCYVGITRAERELMLSCCKKRMIRGEVHYNPVSRFIREIPEELIDAIGGVELDLDRDMQKKPFGNDAYRSAKKEFEAPPFATLKKGRQMVADKLDGLPYEAGDRVSHVKFGEGTVLEIKEGGRDYEVTVDFDSVGVRKMFAMFAKLKKV